MLTRLLVVMALLGTLGLCSRAETLNLIQRENRQPGTTAWQLTNPSDNRQIEGYASLTSVPNGGRISLFVNTNDATYSVTVYRMGWYGGKGGRKVLGPQVLPGVRQVTPAPDATGLLECHWTNPFVIQVPMSWLSGVYLAKLHGNDSGKESYITFAVRDSRPAQIVFQQSVITYQAYNAWPGPNPFCCGGDSLYNSINGVQISQVSFDRPYGGTAHQEFDTPSMFYSQTVSPLHGIGAGDFLYMYAPTAMEFGMVRWLEHEGYDVTYITDVDTHEDINRLLRGKAFLSVGHDEYWTEQMKSNVVNARDQGVNLGFFGGNYMYWAVNLNPDSSGTPNRTIALVDPAKSCTFACMGESEQAIVGGMWVGSVPTNGDIVVTSDALLNHWVLSNTGLKVGDVIPGLIGIEYNGTFPEFPIPNGLQTILHTQEPRFDWPSIPAESNPGGFPLPADFNFDFDGWYDSFVNAGRVLNTTTCDKSPIPPRNTTPPSGWCSNPWPVFPSERIDWGMTIYQADSGAWVFNAGTNQWSWGLDDYLTGIESADGANNGPSFRIQCGYPFFHPGLISCRNSAIEQITRNVLNKFIGR